MQLLKLNLLLQNTNAECCTDVIILFSINTTLRPFQCHYQEPTKKRAFLWKNSKCAFLQKDPSFHKSSRWQVPTEENDATFCVGSRSTVLQARARDMQLPCLTNIHRIWKISYSATSGSNLRLAQPVLGKALAMVLSLGYPSNFSTGSVIPLTVSA